MANNDSSETKPHISLSVFYFISLKQSNIYCYPNTVAVADFNCAPVQKTPRPEKVRNTNIHSIHCKCAQWSPAFRPESFICTSVVISE